MKTEKCYQPNDADIIYENFGNEVVLINLKTGTYYSLVDSAQIIWECIVKRFCLSNVIRVFGSEKDNKIKEEVCRFIDELKEEKLIVSSDQVNGERKVNREIVTPHDAFKANTFTPPVLKKYTDQQELLLLDPIHDVSDLGWPVKDQGNPDET